MTEAWWKECVVYQIYPRSFADSNGDGIGDLQGIISKLDYLKELGVDVIWLSPVYQSPNDDNGYDISDYRAIMTDFGTMEDFNILIDEMHKRDIKLVMDLVVNHTSDEHKWFLESRTSKDNPYRDYYIWKDGKDGKEPNNWGSCFSGSAWEFDEETGMYYLHLFSRKQPDLNWENPKVRDEVFDLMTWWLEKGVDGFRMDVISLISKHQEFEDGPAEHNGYASFNYNANGPRVHEFLREMRSRVLSKYDTITVGECSGVNIEEAKSYASEDGSELSMVFQFDHASVDNEPNTKWTDRKIDLVEFKKILSDWQTSLAGIAWNSLYLGNHDQPRQVSRYGNDSDEYRELSAKMLATSIHMMQGTPYVYQGEELGMTNYPFTSIDEMRDIEAINAFKELQEINYASKEDILRYIAYKGRDNARTPIQWNDSPNGGFTTGTPWIAVNPNYKTINAEEQIHRPDSVFNYYKKLIRLRHENKIIVYGDYELILPESKEIFAYKRIYKDERLIVFCNYSDKTIVLPAEFENLDKCEVLISNYDSEAFEGNSLRPYEAIVLVI